MSLTKFNKTVPWSFTLIAYQPLDCLRRPMPIWIKTAIIGTDNRPGTRTHKKTNPHKYITPIFIYNWHGEWKAEKAKSCRTDWCRTAWGVFWPWITHGHRTLYVHLWERKNRRQEMARPNLFKATRKHILWNDESAAQTDGCDLVAPSSGPLQCLQLKGMSAKRLRETFQIQSRTGVTSKCQIFGLISLIST